MTGDIVGDLEQAARRRFVRWDDSLWREIVEGPASALADSLAAAGLPEAHSRSLLENYLRLACEGIGLGYLFPTSAGATGFFTLAWTRLIPRGLASLPPEQQAAALADCWNLGENLESSPLWLRRIFLRLCHHDQSLGSLPSLVADVARRALEAPDRALSGRGEIAWVALSDEDRRFLPGALHFVAPTVVCVHDRLRTAEGGADAASVGVWLSKPALPLGPMACKEAPKSGADPDLGLLEDLARRDRRASDWFDMARNEWRAAVTLETSQFLVVLLPAEG